MATATLHIAEVGGYPGPARCWKLDPPVQFDGIDYEFVTVWVQPSFANQGAEVGVVAATGSGACADTSVRRRPGSYVLPDDPDTPVYFDGCHFMALQILGGYTVSDVEEQE